jgi:hypothetical protein
VSDKTLLTLVVTAAMVATAEASTAGSEQEPSGAMAASVCETLRARHVDKQANPRAGGLSASCRQGDSVPAPPKALPSSGAPSARVVKSLLGGSDLNVITGTETYPAVTQAGSMVWGSGTTVVTVYNDTREAPSSFSGMSVSTDGGANFTRLDPNPFASVFAEDFGSPSVADDASASLWLATTIASDCGGQGIGLMTPPTLRPASWTGSVRASPRRRPSDPLGRQQRREPFYGRRYVAFNDFNAGGVRCCTCAAAAWHEVSPGRRLHPQRARHRQLGPTARSSSSRWTRGRCRQQPHQPGLPVGQRRRHLDRLLPGPSFPPAGAGLCSASDYFYMVPPLWRHGMGPGAVGRAASCTRLQPRRAGPGDLGDIYYIRSTDNGATWSAPAALNSDQLDQNNVVQWQPSISVTSQGYVLAAWYDRRDTTDGLNYQYYGRMSLDNGATFLPEERIADLDIPQPVQVDPSTAFCFAGDSNFHAPLGNVSLATWTDGRNAVSDGSADVQQMDVYFDRVSLCPTIAVSPAALPNGQATVAYSQTVTAAGSTGPYTFSLARTLPIGLGLDDGTGTITGTPTATGITPFAIVATNDFGCTGSRDYSLVVDPEPAASCPAISIAPRSSDQGAPCSATVTASSGRAVRVRGHGRRAAGRLDARRRHRSDRRHRGGVGQPHLRDHRHGRQPVHGDPDLLAHRGLPHDHPLAGPAASRRLRRRPLSDEHHRERRHRPLHLQDRRVRSMLACSPERRHRVQRDRGQGKYSG